MTAGNSTPLSDGAATVLLASDEWAAEHGFPVLAHLTRRRGGGRRLHPRRGRAADGAGLRGGAAAAAAGLGLGDFDFYEIHEAFAAQVLTTLAAWERDGARHDRPRQAQRRRLLARGRATRSPPPAARIVATAAKLLAEQGSGRALISICAAGGQGVVAIMER